MNSEEVKDREIFRDSVSTVTKEGKRKFIYPKKPSGKFYTARTVVSYFLLAFLFIAPFIKLNGHPFIILNFLERKFIIFGIPFGPHDFYLLALAIITLIVSVFLFTVVWGRLFCGWICPQTIFMEMLFRKIEYLIEGDFQKQLKLKISPMNWEKFLKRTLKHVIFFALSFIISNFFLAYIIGVDQLLKIVTDPPSQHLAGLTAMIIFSLVFYWIYSSFREQVCTFVCPYGRLQGVLLDQNSVVIAYDYKRGEPRGKIRKNIEQNLGDCIDCRLCVDVCPTGIDIRNGTQLECVNCTACIDACDDVMLKVKRPKGLIRYASKNEIETGKRKILTPRAIGYSVVLILLVSITVYLLGTRSDFDLNILRTPGLLFQEQPDGKISNLYDLKIVNKTFNPMKAKLKLMNKDGEIKLIGIAADQTGENFYVEPQEVLQTKFLVIFSKRNVNRLKTPIQIGMMSNGKLIKVVNTSFFGKAE